MRETWYVLEDGSFADPAECALDDAGVMRHKSGAAVATRGDVLSSRGMDPHEIEAARAASASPAQKMADVIKAKAEQERADREAQLAAAGSHGTGTADFGETTKQLDADGKALPAEQDDAGGMKGRELKAEKPGKGYKTKDAKAES